MFRVFRLSVVAFLLLTVAVQARAAGFATTASPVTGTEVLRMLLGLGAVLALLLLVAWFFRRLVGNGIRRMGGQLRVISSLNVGNRARILLVDVEGVRLLLGSGPQRVELITRFEGGVDYEKGEKKAAESESFVTRLTHQLDKQPGEKQIL